MKIKKLLLFLFICISITIKSQIAIEKKSVEGSGILDFPIGKTKGIILPAVQKLPSNPENGTFLLDKLERVIKMYENGKWRSLSDIGDVSGIVENPNTDIGSGIVIGNASKSVNGVLVLDSNDKALILPRVSSPHLTVGNPYPGMMCYDIQYKALAVFDGKVWNYWN